MGYKFKIQNSKFKIQNLKSLRSIRKINLPVQRNFVVVGLGNGFENDAVVELGEAVAVFGENAEGGFADQHGGVVGVGAGGVGGGDDVPLLPLYDG